MIDGQVDACRALKVKYWLNGLNLRVGQGYRGGNYVPQFVGVLDDVRVDLGVVDLSDVAAKSPIDVALKASLDTIDDPQLHRLATSYRQAVLSGDAETTLIELATFADSIARLDSNVQEAWGHQLEAILFEEPAHFVWASNLVVIALDALPRRVPSIIDAGFDNARQLLRTSAKEASREEAIWEAARELSRASGFYLQTRMMQLELATDVCHEDADGVVDCRSVFDAGLDRMFDESVQGLDQCVSGDGPATGWICDTGALCLDRQTQVFDPASAAASTLDEAALTSPVGSASVGVVSQQDEHLNGHSVADLAAEVCAERDAASGDRGGTAIGNLLGDLGGVGRCGLPFADELVAGSIAALRQTQGSIDACRDGAGASAGGSNDGIGWPTGCGDDMDGAPGTAAGNASAWDFMGTQADAWDQDLADREAANRDALDANQTAQDELQGEIDKADNALNAFGENPGGSGLSPEEEQELAKEIGRRTQEMAAEKEDAARARKDLEKQRADLQAERRRQQEIAAEIERKRKAAQAKADKEKADREAAEAAGSGGSGGSGGAGGTGGAGGSGGTGGSDGQPESPPGDFTPPAGGDTAVGNPGVDGDGCLTEEDRRMLAEMDCVMRAITGQGLVTGQTISVTPGAPGGLRPDPREIYPADNADECFDLTMFDVLEDCDHQVNPGPMVGFGGCTLGVVSSVLVGGRNPFDQPWIDPCGDEGCEGGGGIFPGGPKLVFGPLADGE